MYQPGIDCWGQSEVEAVNDAVATRLRPILMSTTTTIFGLLLLVVIPGAGTEFYRGVDIVVLCGLLASMLLTLSFLPCLLIQVFKVTEAKRNKESPLTQT